MISTQDISLDRSRTSHDRQRVDQSAADGIPVEQARHEQAGQEQEPQEPERALQPSRGYQAVLLLAGFTMIFHVIGINSIYGIFQEFYTSSSTNIEDARGQDALVSLVGTIGTGLTWSGSIYANPLFARTQHVQLMMLTGVFIMSMGIFLASFSSKLWHLFLTQAILYGIGASLYYFPVLALTPAYFDRHRGFALGLILSGAGVGGLVLSPVINALIAKLGVRWALRILGLWNFAIGVPVSLVVKKRGSIYTQGRSTRVDLSVAKRGAFIWQAMGAFLQAGGNVVPTYFLTTYAVSVLGYSPSKGSLLLAIYNAINSVARISMGVLADRVGRQNTLIVSCLLSAISVLALWPSAPSARFIAFIASYGVLAGGYNALLPTTIAEVYGVQHYTSVNGAIYFIRGLGALFGAPIAGVILGSHQRAPREVPAVDVHMLQKKYNQVALYDGMLLLAAFGCVAYVRWSDARYKARWLWKA